MKFKKALAAVLAASMLAGFTGCNNEKKSVGQIENLMEEYVDAVNDFDADRILDLTNWEDDSDEYENIKELFNESYIAQFDGTEFVNCVKQVASTVKIDYESDEFVFKDKKTASIKVKYELVDWDKVYFEDIYETYDDVLSALKSCKDVKTVSAKLEFELEDKEWKISKISKIDELMLFERLLPNIMIDIDPVGTEPTTDIDPIQTEEFEDIEAVLDCLAYNETAIKKAEKIYNKGFVNIEDINEDGSFDVMFVAADNPNDDYSSGTLYICEYNHYAGEAVEMITIPEIVYMAEGGSFVVFKTSNAIVITYCHGETSSRQVETFIYDYDFSYMKSYKRIEHHSYDPETDTDNCTYEYYQELGGDYAEISEDFYIDNVKFLADNGIEILGYDYLPVEGELEYPVAGLPGLGFIDYDSEYKAYIDYIN